jgi:hypothetical protein
MVARAGVIQRGCSQLLPAWGKPRRHFFFSRQLDGTLAASVRRGMSDSSKPRAEADTVVQGHADQKAVDLVSLSGLTPAPGMTVAR